MRRASLAWAVIGVAICGCTLLVDTSGLSGGTGGGPTSPVTLDGGADATTADATSGDEGGSGDGKTRTVSVTSALDAIRIVGSTVQSPAQEINAGRGTDGTAHQSGVRFAGLDVPRGASIASAKVRFVATEVQTGAATNTTLSFEATDSAKPWTGTLPDFSARARTNKVSWPMIPAWTPGVSYETPDLAAALQDVVSRSGWSPGNAVVVFWADDASVGLEQQRVAAPPGAAKTTDPVLTVRLR